MPLIHDPEYQKELDFIKARALRENRQVWWAQLLIFGGVFVGLYWVLKSIEASDSTVIAATVAVATLCVLCSIHSAVRSIHVMLTILIAATEWVGRKQLGEYKSPTS